MATVARRTSRRKRDFKPMRVWHGFCILYLEPTKIQRENAMTASGIMQEIKEALEGRPGQPIVLGVCRSLAGHMRREVWIVRLVVVILAFLWTLPTLAGYVIAGFLMSETERRTRDFFSGLAVLARETGEKLTTALGRLFDGPARSDHHGRGC